MEEREKLKKSMKICMIADLVFVTIAAIIACIGYLQDNNTMLIAGLISVLVSSLIFTVALTIITKKLSMVFKLIGTIFGFVALLAFLLEMNKTFMYVCVGFAAVFLLIDTVLMFIESFKRRKEQKDKNKNGSED